MKPVQNLDLLGKARRHHRKARAKDHALAPSVAGGGQVIANGKLRVVLPLTDGATAVYIAAPVTAWRFVAEPGAKHQASDHGKNAEASPADRAHRALDTLLAVVADARRHVRGAETKPDVVNIAR